MSADIDHLTSKIDQLRLEVQHLRTPVVLYTIPEAAAALGVHRSVVYKMIAAGELATVTLATMSEQRIPVAAVEALVAPERWNTTETNAA